MAAIIAATMNCHSLATGAAALMLAATLFTHTVAARLLLLAAGVGLIAMAAWRNPTAIKLIPPLWPFFAAWAVWAAVSVSWSLDPERTLKEFRNEILYSALAFWVCFTAAQARNAVRVIIPTVAVAALVVCGASLHAFTFGWHGYQTGWHGGSGNHSSMLLTLMPCALAIAWYGLRNHWTRSRLWLSGALITVLLIASYTTQNRTIWLGFAVEMLLLVWLLGFSRPPAKARSRFVAPLIVAVILAGSLGAAVAVHLERTAGNAARSLEQDPRLALWSEVLERIEERPWTGYGFGRGLLRKSLREELGDGDLWHAHNIFLEMAMQLGLPGLALFVALLAATLREAWRLSHTDDDLTIACGAALAAVVVGMLARNLTDVLWIRQNALLYWGIVGTLLGLAAARRTGLTR